MNNGNSNSKYHQFVLNINCKFLLIIKVSSSSNPAVLHHVIGTIAGKIGILFQVMISIPTKANVFALEYVPVNACKFSNALDCCEHLYFFLLLLNYISLS